MNKNDLLAIAKGQKPTPPRISVILERNENGGVDVTSAKLINGLEVDIIATVVTNSLDFEFWKTFDTRPLVEEARQKLTGQTDTSTGKSFFLSCQCVNDAIAIEKLHEQKQ